MRLLSLTVIFGTATDHGVLLSLWLLIGQAIFYSQKSSLEVLYGPIEIPTGYSTESSKFPTGYSTESSKFPTGYSTESSKSLRGNWLPCVSMKRLVGIYAADFYTVLSRKRVA